jgi:hypothetical protein
VSLRCPVYNSIWSTISVVHINLLFKNHTRQFCETVFSTSSRRTILNILLCDGLLLTDACSQQLSSILLGSHQLATLRTYCSAPTHIIIELPSLMRYSFALNMAPSVRQTHSPHCQQNSDSSGIQLETLSSVASMQSTSLTSSCAILLQI